jgi:elongation factor Ts
MNISAGMVKDLRERTGVGMMECKKALTETQGDIEKAILWLRERGLSRAAQKATRVAAQGVVDTRISADHKSAVIVEVNCETDFVANGDEFRSIVGEITETALKHKIQNINQLAETKLSSTGNSVANSLAALVAKIGENMQLRRLQFLECNNGVIAGYIHSNGKIGTLAALSGANDAAALTAAKDVAMHAAAASPRYLNSTSVPSAEVEQEKELSRKKMAEEKKPADIIEKILTGQIAKFFKEICLVEQPFVKDPNLSVAKYVASVNPNLTVTGFIRYALGEGIEKKTENFAEEVAAQLNK